MTVPCNCCPTSTTACAMTSSLFATVTQTTAAAGWAGNLPPTIDGITNTTVLSGYTSPAGIAPTPTPVVEYTIAARNRVRGLRLWNQGGGNLNDADGLGAFTAEFYAGATLLYTFNTAGANGAAAQSLLLPGGLELNGVDRVVLRNLAKQIAGTVAPLWRELQLLSISQVYGCRTPNGVQHWYDEVGNETAENVGNCPCPGECWSLAPAVDLTATPFTMNPLDGVVHNLSLTSTTNRLALTVPNNTPASVCGPPNPVFATIFNVGQSAGSANYTYGPGGAGIGSTGSSTMVLQMDFWQPVDLQLQLYSYSCVAASLERFQFITPCNEFIAGPGSNLASNPAGYPVNTVYCDNNAGASQAIYRNVTTVQWRQLPNASFFSGTLPQLLKAVPGWVRTPC